MDFCLYLVFAYLTYFIARVMDIDLSGAAFCALICPVALPMLIGMILIEVAEYLSASIRNRLHKT